MNFVNWLFRNVRTDTRIWNKAYQAGFEFGVKAATNTASAAAKNISERYQSQFIEEFERPLPPAGVWICEEPTLTPWGVSYKTFFANAAWVRFEIWPNKSGYATWETIDMKFKEKA